MAIVMSDIIRLDPSPSRVFSWLEYEPDAPELLDERTKRLARPAASLLRVHYRFNGAEWEFWPVTQEEAQAVMHPGAEYDFSIGRAFGEIIKAHKSGRMVKSGERRETVRQREEIAKREGRRWLA